MRRPVGAAALVAVALGGAAVAVPGPSTARASATHTVRFGEYFFTPGKLVVHVGDRVRFVNVGRIEHTVADSTRSGTIRSRIIRPRPLAHGQSQTVRFTRKGTVYYLCTLHPTMMRGEIVVR